MDDRRLSPRLSLPWAVAVVLFIVAIDTAPEVLDFDAVAGGLLAVVAAAAALPFGLISSRFAPLGWLISAGSALLISRTIPALDDDPWPLVHSLVLLAFVFAVSLRPPATLPRPQQLATVALVLLGTAALFGTAAPDHLRLGWVLGVAAAAGAGALLRWLGWLGTETPRSSAVADLGDGSLGPRLAEARRGFRTAYLSWVRSPPTGPPFARGLLGERPWAEWIRGVMPWALAFGVFWIAVASIGETLVLHDLVLPFFAALVALPIGLARQYALLSWRLATLLAIAVALVGTPSSAQDPGTWPVIQQWVWLITMFLASVRHERSTAIWVWAATVATMSAGATDNTGTVVTLTVAASALALIADLLRTRRLASRALERQTELSELEKARRTVLEERARIARDLHDVVAHHMSMVVVQAETAPFRIPGLPDAAQEEFSAVGASARQALNEIRSLLGVLRSDDQGMLTAPQPGLEQLSQLVTSVERSGVPVGLTITGTPGELATASSLSAYRIVQESLANAARHAPGAAVRVLVDYTSDDVRLRVVNDPPPEADPPEPPAAHARPGPPGHGLLGMRERAAVVGGTLDARPRPDGGFEVCATIPRHAEEPPDEQ